MKTITKLAINRIKMKRTHSAVICASILLTTVLLMTIVSISANIISGYGLMLRIASGTDYHGYLRTTAFTLPGPELRDAALKSNDIAEAVISSNAAQYALEEAAVSYNPAGHIRVIEKEQDLRHFYTDITDGSFPKNDNEILINPLSFPEAGVGDIIGLYYNQKTGEVETTAYAEFTVSGLMKSRGDSQMHVVMKYSDTLMEKYNFPQKYTNVYFIFDNTMNMTGKAEKLENDTLAEYLNPDYEKHLILNSAYLEATVSKALNPANAAMIIFAVAIVTFCSFLLIYNIYSIALTQDMQSFGLLSVIGTTYAQLRRMTVEQSLILLVITLPFGLTAGYFIGWKVLSPVLFTTAFTNEGVAFEFSPWIVVFTLLLTTLTLLYSATRPLKKLKSMTPIATVDYSPTTDLPKRCVRKKVYAKKNTTPTAGSLAKYSVSRSRKKTVIIALSMSLSVILFMFFATLCEYIVTYTENNLQFTDYVINTSNKYCYKGGTEEYTMQYQLNGGVGMSEDYIKSVESSTSTEKVWRIRTAMTELTTPPAAISKLEYLREAYPYFESWTELVKAAEGKLDTIIVGIPDDLFPQIKLTKTETLGEDYSATCIVYDGGEMSGITIDDKTPYPLSYFHTGDKILLNGSTFEVTESEIYSPTNNVTGWLRVVPYTTVFYLPESTFLTTFPENQTVTLLINAKENCYDSLRAELDSLSDTFSVTIDEEINEKFTAERESGTTVTTEELGFLSEIKGRMDNLDQMQEIVAGIGTVGYSLAGMIFLVGVLNIVNTALSSVTERKREFAMLEAVGMTDRQMLLMLLKESLYSGGAAVLITVFAGFPMIWLIINTAMDAIVTLHWQSGVIMLALCVGISVLSGTVVYKMTKSAPVVERIKVE